MTETINAGTVSDGSVPQSSTFAPEPWALFYQAGEKIRELRKERDDARTRGAGHVREDEAASRMDDEGCPNDRTPRS